MYGKTVVYDIETEIARDVLNLETDPCNLGEYETIMDMHCAREDRRATDVTMTWKKMSIVEVLCARIMRLSNAHILEVMCRVLQTTHQLPGSFHNG